MTEKQCCGTCKFAKESKKENFMFCEIIGHVKKDWGTMCKAYVIKKDKKLEGKCCENCKHYISNDAHTRLLWQDMILGNCDIDESTTSNTYYCDNFQCKYDWTVKIGVGN